MPRSTTPADCLHHACDGAANVAFRSENDVGSAFTFLSRLNHAACKPPVYASQPRSPSHHATLGPGRRLPFAGAGLTPASSHRRFRYVIPSHTILLLQASPGALSAETFREAFPCAPALGQSRARRSWPHNVQTPSSKSMRSPAQRVAAVSSPMGMLSTLKRRSRGSVDDSAI
jgi:hypothetical protein